ncbi:hypothetical protein BHU72_02175 [Desulfuribacillus stibiiarsenatis]|uniref:protein-glutamate O-methyltransferase n=1 Tax=Desulfuribacillus stibiiarsenatis TaxID=1390249 RepID=A0A1E5L652_9FIRM|nr:protein-glutamate O-methyltransferase CheR [Desulfuribacillus stibiiarsenatis]OEH85627.1 hypothetical protein BHU72_02175 [Desulfuribacillus stibiiarsenatis]
MAISPNDISLSEKEYIQLRDFIYKKIGVNLTESKKTLIVSRLSKRLRELNLASFEGYFRYIDTHKDEVQVLFNRLTTNVTNFFRENHHFEYLTKQHLPKIMTSDAKDKVLRIWSSACSTGEEPYTIAMVIDECLSKYPGWRVEILASDINTDALKKAQEGIYTKREIQGISYERLKEYFKLGVGPNAGLLKVKDSLRKYITFRQINLSANEYTIQGKLHVIFCRNVFIYFDKPTQNQITTRFANMVLDDGILFLGHSESIQSNASASAWNLVQQTIYKKNSR